MVRYFRVPFSPILRRGSATVLAFTLCCGFLFGSLFAALSGSFSFSMMRTAMISRVSIVSLFAVMLLPLLFTAYAVWSGRLWLVIPVAFCKAVSFGFLGASVMCVQGNSGWLLRLLFLFSDSLTFPILCWFWVRALDRRGIYRDMSVVCSLILGIVILDCQFISPFLVNLLL